MKPNVKKFICILTLSLVALHLFAQDDKSKEESFPSYTAYQLEKILEEGSRNTLESFFGKTVIVTASILSIEDYEFLNEDDFKIYRSKAIDLVTLTFGRPILLPKSLTGDLSKYQEIVFKATIQKPGPFEYGKYNFKNVELLEVHNNKSYGFSLDDDYFF